MICGFQRVKTQRRLSRPDKWGSPAAGPGSRPEPGLSGRVSLQAASRTLCCRSSRGSHDPAGGFKTSAAAEGDETTCAEVNTAAALTVWRIRTWASSRTSAVTTWRRQRYFNIEVSLSTFTHVVSAPSLTVYRILKKTFSGSQMSRFDAFLCYRR